MDNHNIFLVGIGGAGRCFLDGHAHSKNIECLYLNTDSQSLNKCPDDKTLLVNLQEVEPSVQLAMTRFNEFCTPTSNKRFIVVVAGLGGETGSVFMPRVMISAKQGGFPVIGIGFLPFSFERKRRLYALEIVNQNKLLFDDIKLIDFDVMTQHTGIKNTLNDILELSHHLAKEYINEVIIKDGFYYFYSPAPKHGQLDK